MTDRMRTIRDLDLDLTRAETVPFHMSDGHRELIGIAGIWVGATRTWLDPNAPPVQSITTARIEVILGGRFVRIDYQGSVIGKPHAGELLIGYEPDEKRYTSIWIDSFHMSPAIMVSTGERSSDGAISLLGSYPADGKQWGWRTVLRAKSDDEIHLDAFNIPPEGGEHPAIETRFARRPPE